MITSLRAAGWSLPGRGYSVSTYKVVCPLTVWTCSTLSSDEEEDDDDIERRCVQLRCLNPTTSLRNLRGRNEPGVSYAFLCFLLTVSRTHTRSLFLTLFSRLQILSLSHSFIHSRANANSFFLPYICSLSFKFSLSLSLSHTHTHSFFLTYVISHSNSRSLFGLVSLFNRISRFVGYLMPKPSFEKNKSSTI